MIPISDQFLFDILKELFPQAEYISKKGVSKGFYLACRQTGKGKFKEVYNVIPQIGGNSSGSENSGGILNNFLSLLKNNNSKASQILDMQKENNAFLNTISGDIGKVLKGVSGLGTLSWMNLGLTAINVGVSVAGFAMLSKKIGKIQEGIDDLKVQLDEVSKDVKETKDLQFIMNVEERYGRLLNETRRITVNVEIGKEITEREVESLIEEYRAFLGSMISFVLKYPSEPVFDIIYSLLPLFANLIILYYEMFFETYGEKLHPNHGTWIDIFEKIGGREFTDMLTDYYTIDKGFHHKQVNDIIAANFYSICDKEQKIADVISIMQVARTSENYRKIMDEIDKYTYDQSYAEFEKVKEENNLTEEMWQLLAAQVWPEMAAV